MMIDMTISNASVRVRDLEPADEPAIQSVFDASEDWFTAAFGQPSAPADVQSLNYALPANRVPEDKTLLVITYEGQIIGVIDIVRHHPDTTSCAVGMFLLHPDFRRRGLGRTVAHALMAAASTDGFKHVRANVTDGWKPGHAFLESLGFTFGELRSDGGNRSLGPSERPVLPAELDLV